MSAISFPRGLMQLRCMSQVLLRTQIHECRPFALAPLHCPPHKGAVFPLLATRYLCAFLADLKVSRTRPGESGVAWIELLILFELRGGHASLEAPGSIGPSAPFKTILNRSCSSSRP